MVEYIDEEHVIKGLIVVGDALTIEESDGHPSAGSLCDIDPRDLEPWFFPAELLGQGPVSAAHIEEGALLGKQPGQVMGEGPHPARSQPGTMELLCEVHRRLIPSMLTKNPERMVWMPRAANVTPGTTCLRVDA